MEPNLGLLGGGGGGGGGAGEAELELGLGLSLGSLAKPVKSSDCTRGEYGRILTAKDFPNGFPTGTPRTNGAVSGTKRAADSEAGSPPTGVSQVVGWPPIRSYRMNSLVNQGKTPNAEDDKGMGGDENKENSKKKMNHGNNSDDGCAVKEKGSFGFVKVNMDGLPIGRKVDLNAHTSYETLAQTLEEMFFKSTTKAMNSICGEKEQRMTPSKLLDGSSDFVLTYEDKEGDWMLVGDVPWGMFLCTVKRLRIMQWLSSTTRHVRIYAAYIDPETCAFDQTQMDKLTLLLDPTDEFLWTDETCNKVYSYFQELVDHYEGAPLTEYTLRLIGSDIEHYIRRLLYAGEIQYNMDARVLNFSMGKPRIGFNYDGQLAHANKA